MRQPSRLPDQPDATNLGFCKQQGVYGHSRVRGPMWQPFIQSRIQRTAAGQ